MADVPDLILFRNNTGVADFGAAKVAYGLGRGSPDLVGCYRGRWFCLEVKRPGEKAQPHQIAWANRLALYGGFCTTVTSVEEAKMAFKAFVSTL